MKITPALTAKFLQSRPSPSEALLWLAYQRLQSDSIGMTIEQAIDAVLLDARRAAIKKLAELNERIDLEEARDAKRAGRVQ
jgi:hypothetical protein